MRGRPETSILWLSPNTIMLPLGQLAVNRAKNDLELQLVVLPQFPYSLPLVCDNLS